MATARSEKTSLIQVTNNSSSMTEEAVPSIETSSNFVTVLSLLDAYQDCRERGNDALKKSFWHLYKARKNRQGMGSSMTAVSDNMHFTAQNVREAPFEPQLMVVTEEAASEDDGNGEVSELVAEEERASSTKDTFLLVDGSFPLFPSSRFDFMSLMLLLLPILSSSQTLLVY